LNFTLGEDAIINTGNECNIFRNPGESFEAVVIDSDSGIAIGNKDGYTMMLTNDNARSYSIYEFSGLIPLISSKGLLSFDNRPFCVPRPRSEWRCLTAPLVLICCMIRGIRPILGTKKRCAGRHSAFCLCIIPLENLRGR
jgi:hypothetical protein